MLTADPDSGFAGDPIKYIIVNREAVRLLDNVTVTFTSTATQVIVGGAIAGVSECSFTGGIANQDVRFSFQGVNFVEPQPLDGYRLSQLAQQYGNMPGASGAVEPFHFTTTPDEVTAPIVEALNGNFGNAVVAAAALVLPGFYLVLFVSSTK